MFATPMPVGRRPIAFDDRDGGARRVDRLRLGPRERVELGELRGRRLGGRHREGRDNRGDADEQSVIRGS
jgi:hypothetical protein